jgi:hypothetical protein
MRSDEELTRRYRKKVYVGRSKGDDRKQPSLEQALKNAYSQAMTARTAESGDEGDEVAYRVIDIWAVGRNPLSEYIVSVEAET